MLTYDQRRTLDEIQKFMQSDSSCFILKGYAGTGKTYLTKIISNDLEKSGYVVHLIAPTGRAARILKEKTGLGSSTIHKAIYNLNSLEEQRTGQNDNVKFKFKYGLNHIETNTRNIYLIDEASMISDKISEGDFFIFGSGRLLTDLIQFVAPSNRSRNDKMIFIGDPAQLPPVADPVSGALSDDYLREEFNIPSIRVEMREVVRQSSESGVLELASDLRDLLKKSKPERISFSLTDSQDVSEIDATDVADNYLANNPDLDFDKIIVINYSNKSAYACNEAIRNKLFSNVTSVQENDILIISQNNYNYSIELMNGTLAKVVSVSPDIEVKSNLKSYDENGNDCRVTHKFRKVEIIVDGERQPLNCLILENFLFSERPSLDYAENIALYLDFKIRNPHMKPGTDEFKDALKADPYFNALRVKFGYSITCHKAQGGEWESAIVNMDVSLGKSSDQYIRWVYTAVTRASRNLYYFNYTRHSHFSKLEFMNVDVPESIETKELPLVFELNQRVKDKIEELGLKGGPAFLIDNVLNIMAVLNGTDIYISHRKPSSFCEEIWFSMDGKNAAIKMWYNGKQRFTKSAVHNQKGTDVSLGSQILEKINNSPSVVIRDPDLIASNSESINKKPEIIIDQDDWKSILYNELELELSIKGIRVTKIRSLDYQEQYTFERSDESALVQFYYDGMRQFTKAQPVSHSCNSNALLEDIENVVNELVQRSN